MKEKKDPRKIISHKDWCQKKEWTLIINGGLTREFLANLEQNRFCELLCAVSTHIKCHEPIPVDIIEEYNELVLSVRNPPD